jgi:hypothetical protein
MHRGGRFGLHHQTSGQRAIAVAIEGMAVQVGDFEIERILHLKSEIRNLQLDWQQPG